MKTIRSLCAYYYIGLVIGYFDKKDVIAWADKVIDNGDFPYELIDVSLSANKPLEDTASMLKKAYGESTIVEPLYKILGNLVIEFAEDRITDDQFFSYLRRLYWQGSAFIMDEALMRKLDRLDDAYYLATEGIYGDVETVCADALQELNGYTDYRDIFRRFSP